MRIRYQLTPQQSQELNHLARHSPVPYVRVKALAVYNVGQGFPCYQVAQMLGVERRSVGRWVRHYLVQGAAAFGIKTGRGRRPRVKGEEVEHYLRQSPLQFGLQRTRWTLSLLKQVVPGFHGMSLVGIYQAIKRLGYGYKRGQPTVHSPDPAYWVKRGL